MIKLIESAARRYERTFDVILLGGWQLFAGLAGLVVLAGQARSCIVSIPAKPAAPPKVVTVDASNPTHRRLKAALDEIASLYEEFEVRVAVVQSQDINAASLGEGRFLLWEGLSDLSDDSLQAILAHEVAHDALLHSRKVRDMSEFVQFWTELVAAAGHADFEASEVIEGWGQDAVIPKYSRNQEVEADRQAVELLRAMGYQDPAGVFAAALQDLLRRYGDTGGAFGDSHPATSERIKVIRALPNGT